MSERHVDLIEPVIRLSYDVTLRFYYELVILLHQSVYTLSIHSDFTTRKGFETT